MSIEKEATPPKQHSETEPSSQSHARYDDSGPRPNLVPSHVPPRPNVDVRPFPPAGLKHRAVREQWSSAHLKVAEGRYRLQPYVLRAYAEAQLACERWDAQQGGKKPSGDLRYPVPRNRLQQIVAKMTEEQELSIRRSEDMIDAIASGDIVGVEMLRVNVGRRGSIVCPMFTRQSELDRKAALEQAKANRTPEEIEAEDAQRDEMIERLIADLPEAESVLETPNLPDLPLGRPPTRAEIAAFSNAVERHVNYVEKGRKIEAQRQKDAEVKVRTAARKAAEEADPQGAAEAKLAIKQQKAADRQRRWRERQKAAKDKL